jgi:hypothetical protein
MNDVNSFKYFLKRWTVRLHFLYNRFQKVHISRIKVKIGLLIYTYIYLFIYFKPKLVFYQSLFYASVKHGL